ncbi:hypothetical protein [Halopseudomonas pertucinogena]|nr:hypothetical protein [Halopseudomonas pertucinogena]
MNNSALVLNSLALFYALCGGWLIIATQLRTARAVRLLSSPSGVMEEAASAQRGNRLFMRVGGLCLGLALLLSIASALV